MKKTIYFWARATITLLLAALSSTGAWATNEVVTVGTPGSGHILPIGAYNKYVLTQQVYRADEINHEAGNIWSIGFNTVKGDVTRHLAIYLTLTEESGVYAYNAPTDDDLFFSGDMLFKPDQWNTIEFDKEFYYDGTSNILITICDDTGTKGDYTTLTNRYYNPGSTNLIYATRDDEPYNPTDDNESTSFTSISSWKAQIQLTFSNLPTPSNFQVNDIEDVCALVQCSPRGDATAWNLGYKQVEEEEWTTVNNITDRSYQIQGLTAGTRYEAKVQGCFEDEQTSDWTEPIAFYTNFAPLEDMCDLIYSMNCYNASSAAFTIEDDLTGIEVARVTFNMTGVNGGAIQLCVGRKYNVKWEVNDAYSYQTQYCTFTLFFAPGDEFYTMQFYEAPEEDALLTSFVMQCEDYCTTMPRFVTATNVTTNSATINYSASTQNEQLVYSENPDFNPDEATPVIINHELTEDTNTFKLTGLESLTTYYIRMRSVCDNDEGVSRWTEPLAITTGSIFDKPSAIVAQAVNSTTEKLSWKGMGAEVEFNLYCREQGQGNDIADEDVQTFGKGNANGFEPWGEREWCSYGEKNPYSNMLFVGGIQAGSTVGFKAGQAKSGAGQTQFLHGLVQLTETDPLTQMTYFDEECLNDADRQKRIDELEARYSGHVNVMQQADKDLEEGNITQEEHDNIVNYALQECQSILGEKARLALLKTDAEKVQRMKEIENRLKNESMDGNEKIGLLRELNNLRAMTSAAEDPNKDGFAVGNDDQDGSAKARAPFKEAEEIEKTYVFFIRHSNDNGMLLVKDLTIVPPENQGEWTVISGITNEEYTLAGLKPATAYEVMVEPVYEDGTTGVASPITVFVTIGEETEPTDSEFSVSENKTVNFAKGNLQYNGIQETWAIAKKQYEVLGEENVDAGTYASYPADIIDILCWSTADNRFGVSSYYYNDDEEANPLFTGDFADWGQNHALVSCIGDGWQTLTRDEWNYLLNERENAQELRAFATVNDVKGLIILPDVWEAPDGIAFSTPEENVFDEGQWNSLELAGAVFLPTSGQMTASYVDYKTTTTFTEAATYWTATPSEDESGLMAYVLDFGNNQISLDNQLNKRTHTAVRLVKVLPKPIDITLEEEQDNAELLAENDGAWANATLIRTVVTGSYNSFAAPFEISAEQFNQIFGEDAKAKELIETAYEDGTLTMTFADATTLEAGKPYLIKVTTDVENPTFEGITISGEKNSIETAFVNLVPTFGRTEFGNDGDDPKAFRIIGAANTLYYPSTLPAQMKGFRAYLLLKEGVDTQCKFHLDFGNGESTDINVFEYVATPTKGDYYDLQGRKLSTPPITKGVYIVNGNKVIIK